MDYLPVMFAMVSALAFGCGDFAAGWCGRYIGFGQTTMMVQCMGLIIALMAVSMMGGIGLTPAVVGWGVLAGASDASATLLFYRGLSRGTMSVVAPLAAVVSVILPVMLGLMWGERWSFNITLGVLMAIPAITLIAMQRVDTLQQRGTSGHGVSTGLLSGVGFAIAFIAYDQAGTASGAWPVAVAQIIAFGVTLPFGWRVFIRRAYTRKSFTLLMAAGVCGVLANLAFLAATGHGRLSVVAVLASLGPAFTVLLARLLLHERWARAQVLGLIAAFVAVVFISAG